MENLIKPEELQTVFKDINMCQVASSNLIAIGYSAKYKALRVIFKNNTSYIYFNVEPEIWEHICKSESKGKSLNESIIRNKEKYKYIKL